MKRAVFLLVSPLLLALLGATIVHTPTLFTVHANATRIVQKQKQVDERIIGNRNSGIYHWPGCPSYNRIAPRNRVYFKTRAEAEQAGYRAARNC
jgi:methylphosphotriester-DNA--protein-cysteine methyltransferase